MSAAGVYQAWLCFVTEPEEGIERTDTIAGGRSRVIFDRSKKSCSKDRRACRYKAAFSDDAHARDRPCHSHGAGFSVILGSGRYQAAVLVWRYWERRSVCFISDLF